LTLQYDKVVFLLEPNAITRELRRKRVTAIRYRGLDLAYTTFDKLRQVSQATVVENKHLGADLPALNRSPLWKRFAHVQHYGREFRRFFLRQGGPKYVFHVPCGFRTRKAIRWIRDDASSLRSKPKHSVDAETGCVGVTRVESVELGFCSRPNLGMIVAL